MMESSSDRHEGGVVGFGLVGDARVSGDGKGVAVKSDEGISSVLEDGGIDVRLNDEVSGSVSNVDDEKIGENLVELGLDRPVSKVDEFHAIDLVVDLNRSSRKGFDHNWTKMNAGLGANEKQANDVELTEKEGEYGVLDLVWGKVKSHPWWPGQILDPSASTDEARKYFKKDGFLIAYFGDKTFAWNESFHIKPFRISFYKMVIQSNAEAFCRAVDQALHEAGRRVELGLLCLCVSEEVYSKVKSQIVVNAGIRKESSRIDGGDRFSTVASFKPANAIQNVLDLAMNPFGMSKLEVSTVKAQLSAFNRWKGYHQLHPNQLLDGLDGEFDDYNSGIDSTREEKVVSTVASFKPANVIQNVLDLAKNPFGTTRLEVSTTKAQLSAFNSWKGYHQLHPNEVLDGLDSEFDDDNPGIGSMREGKVVDVEIPTGRVTKKRKLNGRGSVLRKSKPVFDGGLHPSKKVRCMSDLMSNGNPIVSDGKSKTGKAGRKWKGITSKGTSEGIQIQTADEFLSQICLAARNPMEGQHNLMLLARFSSDFRNYRLEMNPLLGEDKNDVDQIVEIVQQSEATEVAGFTGVKDSYWTDRIIEVIPDEQVSSDSKSLIVDSRPNPNQESSATALILKFSSLDSVPSVRNLNQIFGRYGPLRELETKLIKTKNCVKVVFERRGDAETAFSSSGKFSIFGPALLSYCLDYSPKLRRTPTAGRQANKRA
ncbi:uncharacterized protein LOC112527538 [Cynara cardunculus var. scolymus]|uniref:PWWP-like protein n=1 Tax=Cynara cardunculus var. scolymus TaxID=59895 RepID=A0A103YI40_CYNCS|nr:uncharacterized protein LOC112527538 [Cynara cardunculus var. scolymus]KVI09539.1 PWWP-like protein [Cynara cardunculus var. scolymus]